jgi:AcrR family transcriptional regulator
MSSRRDEIMDAALVVAQTRGLAAMSMRAVAEQTGSSVMALYRHVASKDELLDGLVGRVLAEVQPPDPTPRGRSSSARSPAGSSRSPTATRPSSRSAHPRLRRPAGRPRRRRHLRAAAQGRRAGGRRAPARAHGQHLPARLRHRGGQRRLLVGPGSHRPTGPGPPDRRSTRRPGRPSCWPTWRTSSGSSSCAQGVLRQGREKRADGRPRGTSCGAMGAWRLSPHADGPGDAPRLLRAGHGAARRPGPQAVRSGSYAWPGTPLSARSRTPSAPEGSCAARSARPGSCDRRPRDAAGRRPRCPLTPAGRCRPPPGRAGGPAGCRVPPNGGRAPGYAAELGGMSMIDIPNGVTPSSRPARRKVKPSRNSTASRSSILPCVTSGMASSSVACSPSSDRLQRRNSSLR